MKFGTKVIIALALLANLWFVSSCNNVAHTLENIGTNDFILLAYTDKLYNPSDTIAYSID